MTPPSDQELDLLLSRGRVRGPAAERARQRLLDDATAPRPARGKRLRVLGPLVALAAAAGIFLVARSALHPDGTGFRQKGGNSARPVLLGLTCSNGTPAACHRGARVSVAFADGASGYVGGYAEPERGGERIWYFSAEDGVASVASAGGPALATRSVVLGPEHAPGRYRVVLVVARRPLGRAEILGGATPGVLLRTSLPLTVVAP
jgi:hypothetical protein